jgi:anti-sigma regulatory factor (Ser/Thr protein kinase)
MLLGRLSTERVCVHELVFGELVSNAVRHGDEPMSVTVAVEDGFVRIETENAGTCFELERKIAEGPTTTSGRGLIIVQALASALIVEHHGTQCRVTALLPL